MAASPWRRVQGRAVFAKDVEVHACLAPKLQTPIGYNVMKVKNMARATPIIQVCNYLEIICGQNTATHAQLYSSLLKYLKAFHSKLPILEDMKSDR